MQFFILGRNPELSRAEIFSYFIARGMPYKEILFKENFLVLECEEINIQFLGGTLKSGKITFSGNLDKLKDFISKEDLIPADKFTYSVLGNFEDVEDILINKFKSEKRRAMIRHGHKSLKLQEGDILSLPKSDFQLFCFIHNEIFLGLVEQDYDFSEIKQRDMLKPVRRESLAISPRLAKILINLSQAKPGNTLLDPFCGVGGILQEALIQNINVVGLDKDKAAIDAAVQNMKWLGKNYKLTASYQLITQDSRTAPERQFDAIACEPSLGELVRKKPSNRESEEIIRQFEAQIIPILQRLKKVKKTNAKLAITFPFVRDISVNIGHVCTKTGLQIYKDLKSPIREFRPDQFIGREIYVLI
jgi:tRNA G10  N-methylase Trm11